MTKKVKDIWHKLKNILNGNTSNKNYLTHTEIENTPFKITGSDDQGYVLTIGNYRLTEPTKTPEEAEEKLYTEQWLLISRLVATYLDYDKRAAMTEKNTETKLQN